MNNNGHDWLGQQFGEYHLSYFLGRGSFGDVYLGEHVSDASIAAVKVLHVRLTEKRDVKSFINEARTMRLVHSNIARVLDFGIREDDIPFIVMEYAPNGTLRQRHPRNTRLPPATVVLYIKQLADALQYAHERRVIHRDVKPENILLGSNFEILLSDFGIATVAHSTHSVRDQGPAGTASYMAPEQIQGKPVPASDQYALGIMAYEWLCGERPFQGSAMEIAIQHSIATPPSLCAKVPGLSPEIEQVIMKALAKDPRARYANVIAFARALKEASQPAPPPGTTLLVQRTHNDEVRAVAWSPDELHLASGSADATVQVWLPVWGETLIERAQTTLTYRGHHKGVNALSWSPDGLFIASASLDRTVQVWDVATGRRALVYSGHNGWVRAVAWSPDGRAIASGSWDGAVHVWEASTGDLLSTFEGHRDEIRALAWSRASTHLVSASADRSVQIWEVGTAQPLLVYTGHHRSVSAACWSPDGQRVVSGSLDGSVQVWEASTGATLFTCPAPAVGVNALAWSPDGRRIAGGARDNQVYIWDAANGQQLQTYAAHTDWPMALAWSCNGKYLASGSADQTVHIWRAI